MSTPLRVTHDGRGAIEPGAFPRWEAMSITKDMLWYAIVTRRLSTPTAGAVLEMMGLWDGTETGTAARDAQQAAQALVDYYETRT